METKHPDIQGSTLASDTQAAWQVVHVREGDVTAYFANVYHTQQLSVSKVRPDVWAWFPAASDGGLFTMPVAVSKIGRPSRDPHRYAQSFRRMAQKYRQPYHYVEVEVRDTGTDEHLFLYWFEPALEICWAQYGLYQTVHTMILYRRYEGQGTSEDHDIWRFRARLSRTGHDQSRHEFTSTSWRFGEAMYAVDMTAARCLQAGDILVERYPFCLQDDPLIGEPVWSNGYAWLPATYGTAADWERPIRHPIQFLREVGAERWATLVSLVQDQYLEDLVRTEGLTPALRHAVQRLHQAQYFDGRESIDQYLAWMDPELLSTTDRERLFELHVMVQLDAYIRLFVKETLDHVHGHVVGIYRSRSDAEAGHQPYVVFPTVGNWLRRLEHEIQIGLSGIWRGQAWSES
jgi:hypothetical protein